MKARAALTVGLCTVAGALVVSSAASAAQTPNAPNPGPTAGGQPTTSAPPTQHKSHPKGNGNCAALTLLLHALDPFSNCNLGAQAVNGVPQLPGDAAGAAAGLAGDAMDQVTRWMVEAAQTVDRDVMNAATATTTPELTAPWYQQEFGYLAFFGAALAGLVALLGLTSAAVRGDPTAVGEVLYGVMRAGLVTAMVISLTLLALEVADGISAAVVTHMPKQFFQSLASAWGTKGWGGLASSALEFVAALIEVAVGFMLWIELLFRDAAIYVAVLFFPFTLAMAIWPRVSGAHAKLVRTLGIFIGFKPAALIVMMTGANLLLGGVSFYGGIANSVGTILAGLAVLAMAAFAPWALLHLVGLESGVMGSSASRGGGARGGTGASDSSGAMGGDLYAGAISYGGARGTMTAAPSAAQGPGTGGRASASGTEAAGSPGSARGSSAIGGETSRRILPGPIAAAAGLLPAGWQAAQSVASAGQILAGHGAARVHTAAGHGGTRPPTGFSGGRGGQPGNGRPPAPTLPYSPPPPQDATGARPSGGPVPPVHGANPGPSAKPPLSGGHESPPVPPELPPPTGEES